MNKSEWTELQYYHLAELPHDFDPPLSVRRRLGDDLAEVVELMRAYMDKVADDDARQVSRSEWYLFYRGLRIEADMRGFRMRFRPKGITRSQQVAEELEVLGHRMETHVHRARDEAGPFFALRSLWFLAYAALKLRAAVLSLEVSLVDAGPDEVMLENMRARAELSGSMGQLDSTRPTERMQEAGAWAELEYYRVMSILEEIEGPKTLKMLGDDLAEVVELMRAYMRKMDAGGDALAATCTGWWLLYHALKAEGDMRRDRMNLKRGRVFASYGWKDVGEAARLSGAIEGHVNKAYDVTKNSLVMQRSVWFLAYAAMKLRALDSQHLDIILVPGLSDGASVPQDAAEQGDADAQYNLGMLYDDGVNVPQDAAKAAKWFRRAAEQGHVAAQSKLGVMYEKGRNGVPQDSSGVPQDSTESARWFRRAAEQGHVAAQSRLGFKYADGEGVPQDAVQAYAWFSIVAGQGNKNAEKAREFVAKSMTREEISRAQELSREYWEAYVLPFRD